MRIAIFDFDGTVTTKDTLLEFIKFVRGPVSFYAGFLRYAPQLLAYKLGLYPNWKVKQQIFSHFFKKKESLLFGKVQGLLYGNNCRNAIGFLL